MLLVYKYFTEKRANLIFWQDFDVLIVSSSDNAYYLSYLCLLVRTNRNDQM